MSSCQSDRKFSKSDIVKLQCICCLALNVVVNFISAQVGFLLRFNIFCCCYYSLSLASLFSVSFSFLLLCMSVVSQTTCGLRQCTVQCGKICAISLFFIAFMMCFDGKNHQRSLDLSDGICTPFCSLTLRIYCCCCFDTHFNYLDQRNYFQNC